MAELSRQQAMLTHGQGPRLNRAVTPSDTFVSADGRWARAGEMELRDLARGTAGALFVSLPLLFTMEMWQIARSMSDVLLLALLAASFVGNRVFLEYSGYRKRAWQKSKNWDALVTLGIGAVASLSTLFVTGLIHFGQDPYIVAKMVLLETLPTSMGAAVAVNQLGAGDGADPEKVGLNPDLTVVLGSFLGGLLFAFNVAPTMETKVIVLSQQWWQVGATFLLSLGISYLMVAVAQFEARDLSKRRIVTSELLEAAIAYVVAFLVSLLLLAVFGYGTPLDPVNVWLPEAVALAYATTLGGAAGRVVL